MIFFRIDTALVLLALCGTGCGGSDKSDASGTGNTSTQGGAGNEPAPEPCPGGGLAPGDYTFMLSHNGVDYGYDVHVPPGYDDAHRTPLVLNWHGLTSNSAQQAVFSGMNPVADAHNFIVVYPNAPDNAWNAGSCCEGDTTRDDMGFARALIDEVKTQACIDPRRIYSTGMSNGGFMSHRLACEAADIIAAVAPVAGVVGIPTCTPSRPIPVMHFHGTADPLVAYNGSALTLNESVPQILQDWANRDGCKTGPTQTFQQADATCEQWTDCDGGVNVTLCSFEGEGHCWPGTGFCPFGAFTTTMNASEEMAKFFEGFSLP
jgi:polyhydroxybutyrate depolymerase